MTNIISVSLTLKDKEFIDTHKLSPSRLLREALQQIRDNDGQSPVQLAAEIQQLKKSLMIRGRKIQDLYNYLNEKGLMEDVLAEKENEQRRI